MDDTLINTLRSGKAWVLIGSGPSIQMGYPSWSQLAEKAAETIRIEALGANLQHVEDALKAKDFPQVFEEFRNLLGGPRLRHCLQDRLRPTDSFGKIYEFIARWPVPVYLTTNYDDEIQKHLVSLQESYREYSNSEDHFHYMTSDLEGAVFKLHGDLRSDNGLVLSSSQYKEIYSGVNWEYWRTKLTSVFQMQPIVVIGHSLSDPHIRHVLQAATKGAGILNPICWIAPDISYEEGRKYLENYKIRVIPYDNQDGEHRNLFRLIESINNFIPPRVAVRMEQQIARISQSPLGSNAGAPGFFVFNKLSAQGDFEEKRVDVVVAAIEAVIPKLKSLVSFDLPTALSMAGWPNSDPLDLGFTKRILEKTIGQGILEHSGTKLKVSDSGEKHYSENQKRFEHMRERFRESLRLRIRRDYPSLTDSDASAISIEIESSLTGYFRECGLTLATMLFSDSKQSRQSVVPDSILKFINEASARYDNLLKRQAFSSVSIDAFVHGESAEREYLGRISQGFFAFHALGIFGEAAIKRLNASRETVWLIDSNAQIPALALAAPAYSVFSDTFLRLKAMKIRFFTTEKLFQETCDHLKFASKIVKEQGADSTLVMAAAMGNAPFRKSNQFLEGFILWQSMGNPCDWLRYMYQIFETHSPKEEDARKALAKIGIEVISFSNWPGFSQNDFADQLENAKKIKEATLRGIQNLSYERSIDLDKKIDPEAEASIIVKKERDGQYHILSEPGQKSSSWFVSDTSVLNLFENKITWPSDAFMKYASTLAPAVDAKSANQAFETLLWELAQSGVTMLDEKIVAAVFGGIIDQAKLSIIEQLHTHEDVLADKYGESEESILRRISLINLPVVAIQMATEAADAQAKRAKSAEIASKAAQQSKMAAEKELGKVQRFKRKMIQKQWERKAKKKKRR